MQISRCPVADRIREQEQLVIKAAFRLVETVIEGWSSEARENAIKGVLRSALDLGRMSHDRDVRRRKPRKRGPRG